MHREFFRRNVCRGYGLAVVAWVAAFAVRGSLNHWFPPGFPYLTFFPAVVLVAYYGGLRPAVLTATLSGLTAWWFWIGSIGFDLGAATLVAVAFYVFVVGVDIFFITGMDSATRDLAREVERNAALARSRDILLREVQHRVSNNLQVVSALLQLEARSAGDEAARKALQGAASRTALVARIQRSLSDVDGHGTDFAGLARSIVDDALAAAGRADVSVALSGDGALSAEEATPVILILLESVNNALEHAFPGRSGHIGVSLIETARERRLIVADNGLGISGPPAADSLGLRLIRALAMQLGGHWSLEPGPVGAAATLVWPRPSDPG